MFIFLFALLILVGLPLWLWLAARISQVSNSGALFSLFLVAPAFYWTYKLWHDRRANLRVPAVANLAINLIALPALIIYSTHYATGQARAAAVPKDNPRMTAWCREQNDAIYDPVLELCVEPTKAEVLAQEKRANSMGQLEQYLNQHGFAGALDRNATAETTALSSRPDIADAASYRFSPLADFCRCATTGDDAAMPVDVGLRACCRQGEAGRHQYRGRPGSPVVIAGAGRDRRCATEKIEGGDGPL